LANAETIAGESSAVPLEARYFDGTTQVLLPGGEDPETNVVARTKKDSRGMTTTILNIWSLWGTIEMAS
jgi:hypothetical protein